MARLYHSNYIINLVQSQFHITPFVLRLFFCMLRLYCLFHALLDCFCVLYLRFQGLQIII